MTRLPALGARGEGWVVIQGVLLVLVLGAGLLGPAYTGPFMIELSILGGLLALGGLVLGSAGLAQLGGALTPLPRPVEGARLVETGVYRLVRHPIYGGLVLGAAGFALVLRSPLALAGALVLLGFFRLKSAREETWLRAHYPGYAAYAARTRRLLPWIY